MVPGYFSSEHRPALVEPTAPVLRLILSIFSPARPPLRRIRQAQPTASPADPIGRVEKVVGDVTVIRNGVSVALNVGDAVYKSDVVQAGANSSVGIGFPDGTALNLVANTGWRLPYSSIPIPLPIPPL